MTERPYSRYTRVRTWAALYSQHSNAGYALVPHSVTNNSIDVIRCASPADVDKMMLELLKEVDALETFYSKRLTPDQAPAILANVRHCVVLARSSDYYHYHLEDYADFKLVAVGLHDSYLRIPVWEMRTNKRYAARATALAIDSPEFNQARATQFGHNILVAALKEGDAKALEFRKSLPSRTRRRVDVEVQEMQDSHYRGRPLAFQTEAERQEVGSKISAGLKRYYASKR